MALKLAGWCILAVIWFYLLHVLLFQYPDCSFLLCMVAVVIHSIIKIRNRTITVLLPLVQILGAYIGIYYFTAVAYFIIGMMLVSYVLKKYEIID
jgi:hypothetical protein